MTWQPIETAPKRRKVIVSWVNEFGKRRTTFASFFDAGELDMDDSYTDSDGADEDGKNADAGWFEERETGDPGYYELREPLTHWMPLPDPPTVESAPLQNAGATPTDKPVEVGAHTSSSSSLLSPVEGRQPGDEDTKDVVSRSPSDGCASAAGSPRSSQPDGSGR